MKKIPIALMVFLFANIAFSNNLIKRIDSAVHVQKYCIKGEEIESFLNKYTNIRSAKYRYILC